MKQKDRPNALVFKCLTCCKKSPLMGTLRASSECRIRLLEHGQRTFSTFAEQESKRLIYVIKIEKFPN